MTKQIAIVTGGSSGIGESIAHTLSKNGYKVYATSRNPKTAQLNEQFIYLKMDVQNDESVKEAIAKVILKEGQKSQAQAGQYIKGWEPGLSGH